MTTPTWDTDTIITAVNTRMAGTGLFDATLDYEPTSPPKSDGFVWACWTRGFEPVASKSDLANTAMVLKLWGRIYREHLAKPAGDIERGLLRCVDVAMRLSSAAVSFGLGEGLWTDLLGDDSEGLTCQLGYVGWRGENKVFRTADLFIPVIMTTYFPQGDQTS
jgi:hypothetical protein